MLKSCDDKNINLSLSELKYTKYQLKKLILKFFSTTK